MPDINCDFCDMKFPTAKGHWNHMVTIHHDKLSTMKKKPFPCLKCELSYANKQCLDKHNRLVHKVKKDKSKLDEENNKLLLAIMENMNKNNGCTNITNNNYFLSINSTMMREKVTDEMLTELLTYRREILDKYIEYCHVNKNHPETASFKLFRDDRKRIQAERYDKLDTHCNHIELFDEIIRLRIDDIEYLLNKYKIPFDEELAKDKRNSQWIDEHVVRKHIRELKSEPLFWNETRDTTIFYVLEAMNKFYELSRA